jgi:hypothetical protein
MEIEGGNITGPDTKCPVRLSSLITLVSRRCRKAQAGRVLANIPVLPAHLESS